MNDIINPFRPFDTPLNPSIVAIRESLLADIVNIVTAKTGLSVVLLTGGLGVGKSTIVTLQLPEKLSKLDLSTIIVPASPRLTPVAYLSYVASSLGLLRPTMLQEFGLEGKLYEQDIGDITDSSSINVVQSLASASIHVPSVIKTEDFPSILDAFSKKINKHLVLVLDQAEQLIIGDKIKALIFIEALIRASLYPKISVVVVIREEVLSDLFSLAGSFPDLIRRIVRVPGLSQTEARYVIKKGIELCGVNFSNSLVQRLIDRSSETDGTIWPVALHAVCRQIVNKTGSPGKKYSIKDLNAVGDVGGALASTVRDALIVLPIADRSEALYLLDVIVRRSQITGAPRFDELLSILPAYPSEDLQRTIDNLIALRLVYRRASGTLIPAHDAIDVAVRILQLDQVTALEQIISDWASGASVLDRISINDYRKYISISNLPIIQVVFLVELLFLFGGDILIEYREKLKEHCHSKDEKTIVRFIQAKAMRNNKLSLLKPLDLFLLFFDDRESTLMAAINNLVLTTTDFYGHWDEGEIVEALHIASPKNLEYILSLNDFSLLRKLPYLVFNLISRYFATQPKITSIALAKELWKIADDTQKPDILRLMASIDKDFALKCSEEELNSSSICLRGAAFDYLVRHEAGANLGVVYKALADDSAIVRRRVVFALTNLEKSDYLQCLSTSVNDSSPLVREAVMEVVGQLEPNPILEKIVYQGLKDSFEFVRESAV